MNEYVQDLEQRAPALFRGGTTQYSGEYIEGEGLFAIGRGSPVRKLAATVIYTVTNRASAGRTQAEITVPIRDVADFEAALNQRIQEGS